jgi:hypothetical protein
MIYNDEEMLKLVRQQRCIFCGADPPNDPHHLWGRGMGGAMRFDVWWNLVPLCRMCHGKAEDSTIRKDFLCEQVLGHHFWKLNRWPKEAADKFAEIQVAYRELLRSYP